MLDEIISYHRYMTEALLLIMVLNAVVPSLLKSSIDKMIFWTRIGYFAFWMFWSMNIFAGLIVFMFTGRGLTLSVWMMIAVSVVLGVIETYRVIRTRKIWMRGLDAGRFSLSMLGLEMVLLVAVSLYALQVQ